MRTAAPRSWRLTRRLMLGLLLGAAGAGRPRDAAAAARALPPERLKALAALKDVKSWGCQYQGVDIEAVSRSDLDMIVVDPSLNDAALRFVTPEECRLMQTKPDGSRRLVFAYLSVGEVDTKRWFWPMEWNVHPPKWVGAENPNWPGSRLVRYWNKAWRALVFEGPDSILQRILAIGFDGVVLDRVDGFYDWLDTWPSAKPDMVDLVTALAATARASKPGFMVVVQNAELLLTYEDLVAALDGHNKESLLTGLKAPNTLNVEEDVNWSLNYLRGVQQAGKATLATEYVSDARLVDGVRSRLVELGFVPFIAVRSLDRLPGSDPLAN